jgi:hypothetical protein
LSSSNSPKLLFLSISPPKSTAGPDTIPTSELPSFLGDSVAKQSSATFYLIRRGLGQDGKFKLTYNAVPFHILAKLDRGSRHYTIPSMPGYYTKSHKPRLFDRFSRRTILSGVLYRYGKFKLTYDAVPFHIPAELDHGSRHYTKSHTPRLFDQFSRGMILGDVLYR